MEKCPRRGSSVGRFTGNVIDTDSKAFSVKREKPRVKVHAEKKEGTLMTKGKRLDSLTMLQSLMGHPYGVVFNDIDTIRECRPESFKKLEKPIDLETVKSMLENNLYFTIEAFAEDVRTTFSNAMQIFPATDDVHKMAIKLSENFESGFKIEAESLNTKPKTCNDKNVSDEKETQGTKTNPSSRKRKSAAASNDRENIYVIRQELDKKCNSVSVTGTHLVKKKDGKSFDITIVSSAPKNSLGKLQSPAAMSPRRAARVTTLMDRFSGTIKKAEKELAAYAPIAADRKKAAHLKMKEQRKRERQALERMENTAKFGADHEALKEFEWLLRHAEFDNSRILAESMNLCNEEDGAKHESVG